jgi:sugar-specific transcriptional regulator TrmB
MTTQDAVAALERLGLSNYEAQVFVALQKLGEGTAQDVSEESDVPRSQVYGAADQLAERGLVESVESSPKRYRPVSLETARTQLRERMEREQERAFRNLEAIQHASSDRSTEELATLRGRHPVNDRVAALVGAAERQVIYVCATEDLLSAGVERALRDRAEAGLVVLVATSDAGVQERLEDALEVVYMDLEEVGGFTGRSLLVDDATVLLSNVSDGEDEVAMWADGGQIAEILAGFIRNGMASRVDLAG